MIFNHRVELIESENGPDSKYIFLDENESEDDRNLIAQVISLDVRGEYDFFLRHDEYIIQANNSDLEANNYHNVNNKGNVYGWSGNIFNIIVDEIDESVTFYEHTDDGISIKVALQEWIEALYDWKDFYLTEMGFRDFSLQAMNHMMGVLLLVYDQISDYGFQHDMLTEAINKCARRFGISPSAIYRDCKKMTGLYEIEEFSKWVNLILGDGTYTVLTKEEEILMEFVLSHITNNVSHKSITTYFEKFFNRTI